METQTTTITTTITTTAQQQQQRGGCPFGLTETRRATLTLRAPPAQDCPAVPLLVHPGLVTAAAASAAAAASFQSAKSKALKRQRSSSPELLRCKRRLSFNGLMGYAAAAPQPPPVAVARRNERERNRVKQVNAGFQTLRQHVPNGGAACANAAANAAANRKMSKVETLRSAVEYIRALQQLLDEHDAVSAAFRCGGLPSSPAAAAAAASDDDGGYSAEPGSPRCCSSSCGAAYSSSDEVEPLSSEEQELLDFTTWFDRY